MNRQRLVLVVLAAVLLTLTAPPLADAAPFLADAAPFLADAPPPPASDEELALRYAPVFYFHPDELFRPQPVDVIVEQARLSQSRRLWFDVNVLLSLDVLDLFDLESDESHFLDVWYGDDGSSAYTNYSAHRAYYAGVLSPEAGGPPVAVYAHVVRDEVPGTITIQYWALYFYNDWFNKHEGDWEMVQVILDADEEPEWVVLSQHHGGTRRAWADAPVEGATHPVAYVAQGSHANYFVGDETYPNGKDIGNARVEIMDRTGSSGRVIPAIIMLPDREALLTEAGAWPGAEWLPFRGHWGQAAPQGDFGGPLGPADKGEQWEQPYAWGKAQPLDTDVWYANRLRVELVGAEPGEAQIRLAHEPGRPLIAEDLGSLAILHYDPPETGVVAEISTSPHTQYDVTAAWPDAETGQVTRFRFANVDFAEAGRATLELGPGPVAQLTVDGTDVVLEPAETETVEATWDAPDLIWIGGVLPAHQVSTGLLLALLAAVVPALAYVGTLYWADHYEKEPKKLLAAAFVWGAIPSVLLAVVMELFFHLPPNLIGPQALEAVRLGLFAPLLQEILKGAPVLLIAYRYRREFDNVLDGIIYGAMVGFGFAMTGNFLSYAGSFLLWGFEGLGGAVFARGVIYAMDHALYTAVFGAGLGYARLAQKRWQRWALPVGGFALAVVSHAVHSLLARNLLGLSPVTVFTTGAGVIFIGVVGVWSQARQHRCLKTELKGAIPDALYRTMVTPGARSRARWRALWREGFRAWRRTRRLHQLCAELAFKRMQAKLRPDEPEMAKEAEALQKEMVFVYRQRVGQVGGGDSV